MLIYLLLKGYKTIRKNQSFLVQSIENNFTFVKGWMTSAIRTFRNSLKPFLYTAIMVFMSTFGFCLIINIVIIEANAAFYWLLLNWLTDLQLIVKNWLELIKQWFFLFKICRNAKNWRWLSSNDVTRLRRRRRLWSWYQIFLLMLQYIFRKSSFHKFSFTYHEFHSTINKIIHWNKRRRNLNIIENILRA